MMGLPRGLCAANPAARSDDGAHGLIEDNVVPQTPREVPPLDHVDPGTKKAASSDGLAPVPRMDPGGSSVLVYRDPRATEGQLFVVVGLALALVGFVDLLLLWFPTQLGTAGWEFATASRTFTNVPMTMVGLVLVAVGLVRRGTRPVIVRRLAVIFAALSFVLMAIGLLFALSAFAVLSQASGDTAADALQRAIVKNGVEIVAYPITFLAMATILWRAVREDKRGPSVSRSRG
jgi:hypothetical protein